MSAVFREIALTYSYLTALRLHVVMSVFAQRLCGFIGVRIVDSGSAIPHFTHKRPLRFGDS
jgi:hypothetical protein